MRGYMERQDERKERRSKRREDRERLAETRSELFTWQNEAQKIRYDRGIFAVLNRLPSRSPVLDCSGIKLNDKEANVMFSSIRDSIALQIHGAQ